MLNQSLTHESKANHPELTHLRYAPRGWLSRLGALLMLASSSLPSAGTALVFPLAGVAIASSASGCQTYDMLIEKDARAGQKWADYEAQLQRRYDLIPNLVETVKAAAKSEQQILTQVTEARAAAASIKLSADDLTNPEKMAAFQKAQDNLKGSLSRLMVVQEQYPDLKSNANFRNLQVEISGTENRILRAREEYNKAATEYNVELGKIRGTAVNKVTGQPFKPRVLFSASSEAQAAPKVSF
ncbi:MAG: LemA family protein [Polyangiaceae bacterium]